MNVFNYTIDGWKSWGNVFQSIEEFKGIVKEIYLKEGLEGYDDLKNLTPGTNAVFKAGNYVVKIFAPVESGMYGTSAASEISYDYEAELAAMKRAGEAGVSVPRVVANGVIHDKYVFRYIVMEFIDAKEANDVLPKYAQAEKAAFANKLKVLIDKLNTEPPEQNIGASRQALKEQAAENQRWEEFSKKIRAQVKDIIKRHEITDVRYVHGDLTGENVLISADEIYIIDFADSKIAPAEYEYPPLVFDLFKSDIELVNCFFGGMPYDEFTEKLFIGTLLHDFGGGIVRDIYKKWTGKPAGELEDIYEIKALIIEKFKR